jgi:hypothetical protein
MELDAGIGNHDVEAAKVIDGTRHSGFHLAGIGHIQRKGECWRVFAGGSIEFGGHAFYPSGGNAADGNFSAVCGHEPGSGRANPAACSGDEGDFVAQLHGLLPFTILNKDTKI